MSQSSREYTKSYNNKSNQSWSYEDQINLEKLKGFWKGEEEQKDDLKSEHILLKNDIEKGDIKGDCKSLELSETNLILSGMKWDINSKKKAKCINDITEQYLQELPFGSLKRDFDENINQNEDKGFDINHFKSPSIACKLDFQTDNNVKFNNRSNKLTEELNYWINNQEINSLERIKERVWENIPSLINRI